MGTDSPAEKWNPAEEEIMQATYEVLLDRGYPGLSISQIADELGKSKAALYYHYDSKEDLLVAFLEFAVDRFETVVSTETGDNPDEDLEHVIEKLLPLRPNEEQRQTQEVMIALRSQAVTNEAFKEQFTQMDEQIAATIENIIRQGIKNGTFRDVDATRIAEHVLAIVNGTMYTRATTTREDATAITRVSISSYLDSELRSHT
ncbi:TetR/AcrR family transcriptional regulator [Halalkalicoccus subterraneus]|uniref:TetR/AcrR family transcriptional regulator n=1 Tax=Halalkalicoccus subterraneus TaxID=2675002 RepID=UPI000EFD5ED1|nr:TetR/AcrR family transcriptional regulator [Halalkalicoccus subterraneus]